MPEVPRLRPDHAGDRVDAAPGSSRRPRDATIGTFPGPRSTSTGAPTPHGIQNKAVAVSGAPGLYRADDAAANEFEPVAPPSAPRSSARADAGSCRAAAWSNCRAPARPLGRGAPHRALATRARNGPRWTSMTSPTSGGQARRSTSPFLCFELFQLDGDPGGAEVAGMTIPEHGHIRVPVQTAPMGGVQIDGIEKSPPTSPPLAPLLHPRRARKEDGPRRHRRSRTANRHAREAQRSPRPKGRHGWFRGPGDATVEVASTVWAGVAVTTADQARNR